MSTLADWLCVFIITQSYTFAYFFRLGLAPIADVLEREFDATSSELGLCASSLSIGYFTMQIPSGMLLQHYTPEFISLISSLLVGICAILFQFAPNIELATVCHFMNGVAQAPLAISIISISAKRMGEDRVASIYGYTKLYSWTFLTAFTIIQAEVYERTMEWKIMFMISGASCIGMALFLFILSICEHHCCSKSGNIKKEKLDSMTAESAEQSPLEISMQKLRNREMSDLSQHTPLIIESAENQKIECMLFPIKRTIDKSQSSVCQTLGKAAKNKLNWFAAIYAYFIFFVISGLYALWLVVFIIKKYEYSRSTATWISSIMFYASSLASAASGKLSDRYKNRKIFIGLAMVLMWTSMGMQFFPSDIPIYFLFACSIITGAGWGMFPPPFWAIVREYNAFYNASDMAVSLINSILQSGGFVAQYGIGLLLDYHWLNVRDGNDFDENGDRNYSVSDYEFAMLCVPICFGIAFLGFLGLKETHCKPLQF